MTAIASPPATITVVGARSRLLRQISGITAVGLFLGFVVGGIGGRLAMRALFLTSTGVSGIVSDDGFRIGQFSAAATANLLLFATIVGVVGAFVYAAVRPFLLGPRWLRTSTCALGAGAVIGALLVHTDGVDFTLLEPRWFAIALFVALPALFAALAAPLIERALGDDSWFQRAPAPLAFAPLLVFIFPPLLVLALLPALVAGLVVQRAAASPVWSARLRHPGLLWAARLVSVSIVIAGVVELTRDAIVLL